MKNSKKLMRCVTILCTLMLCCCIGKKIAFAGKGKIVQIDAANMLSAAIGDDGTLYTWGNNFYGSLGDGTTSNRWDVREALISDVKSVHISGSKMYALKNDGTVWKWGGQIDPYDISKGMYCEPKKITGLPKVSQMLDGWLILENGEIYSTNGEKYCMGLKNPKSICEDYILGSDGLLYKFGSKYTKPILEKKLSGVVDIDFGNGVYIACLKDGRVYTWGDGYLGNGYNTVSANPVKLDLSKYKIRKVAAGANMFLALDDSGQIWQWGKNPLGYDLFGDNKRELLYPTKVESDINFVDIASGTEHNLAIDVNGEVYEWGYIRYGEFGNDRLHIKTVPEKLVTVMSNNSFDAAWDFADPSCSTNCAVTSPGEMRYYKFTPDQTTVYELGTMSDKDTYGYLYDSTGKQLASNDDGRGAGGSDNNYDFYIKHELKAGETYYIGIRMWSSSVTGRFEVYERFYDDYVNGYNYKGIQSYSGDIKINGVINYKQDKDLIKYVPEQDGYYRFRSISGTDMRGVLLDSKGHELLENDDVSCKCLNDNHFNTYDYYMEYRLEAGQTYYLSTRHYSTTILPGAPYTVAINKVPDDFADEVSSNIEPSLVLEYDSKSIGMGGYINCNSDVDVIGIKVNKTGIYNIKGQNIESLVGNLYDSDGTWLDFSNDTEPTEESVKGFGMRELLIKDKIYYISVKRLTHICASKMYTLKVEYYDDYSNEFDRTYVVDNINQIEGKLDYVGDEDYISFIPKETCVYSIDSFSDWAYNMNLVGELYNGAGQKLAENNNAEGATISENRKDFSVEAMLYANQKYYIKIKDYSDKYYGEYNISIKKMYVLEIVNYYDESFSIRYDDMLPEESIKSITDKAAFLLKKLYNIKLISNIAMPYESIYDVCDKLQYGAVNKYSIRQRCLHEENHTSYSAISYFIEQFGNNSSDRKEYVLWTGHDTFYYDYEKDEWCLENRSRHREGFVCMEDGYLQSAEMVLLHELGHGLGLRDHYHEIVNSGLCMSYPLCVTCNPYSDRGKICLMCNHYEAYDKMVAGEMDDLLCEACKGELFSHLNDHHNVLN